MKTVNPKTKRNLVQARVSTEELQEILTKAHLYTNGDISKFVRLAALNYRKTKRFPK